MAEHTIPVDLLNPGQVFACLGFLEAADILLGNAEGGFDWRDEAEVRFRLRAEGGGNPFEAVLRFMLGAEAIWCSPWDDVVERDGGTTETCRGISLSREPSAAELPALLRAEINGVRKAVAVSHWADTPTNRRFQLWTATYANSAHTRLRNAMLASRDLLADGIPENIFDLSANTRSLFRLDPRGDVLPLGAGFSPDRQRKAGNEVRVATYPIVELMAAVGLTYSRPVLSQRSSAKYYVWGGGAPPIWQSPFLLPTSLARAAICGPLGWYLARAFVAQLVQPNDYDLSIDEVAEEACI